MVNAEHNLIPKNFHNFYHSLMDIHNVSDAEFESEDEDN